MGLMDSLMGAAVGALQGQNAQQGEGGAGGLDPQMLIGIVGGLLNQVGGISGLMAKLQSAGLGDAAQSWVGTGDNQPVSGEQLGGALGPDLMGMITQQLGGNSQVAAGVLAQVLPGLVDKLTPQGQVPADNGLGALGDLLGGNGGGAGQLMGMLGSLLGKR